MERKTRTRKASPAERHAARALGEPELEEVTEDVTPSAAVHAARLAELRPSAKPARMSTADWYAQRAQAGVSGPPAA